MFMQKAPAKKRRGGTVPLLAKATILRDLSVNPFIALSLREVSETACMRNANYTSCPTMLPLTMRLKRNSSERGC